MIPYYLVKWSPCLNALNGAGMEGCKSGYIHKRFVDVLGKKTKEFSCILHLPLSLLIVSPTPPIFLCG